MASDWDGDQALSARATGQHRLLGVVLLLAVTAVTACDAGLFPPVPATPDTAHELEKAIEFRTSYGLRADEAWVRRVALDPASAPGKAEFGVALMPDEVADLRDRARNRTEVLQTVRAYGAEHSDDWAGTFVDEAGGGAVVAQFRGNIQQHEAALRHKLGPLARLDVRLVRWSLAELHQLHDRVLRDIGWLETVDADYDRSGVYELFNRVELWVSSANPDAPAAITKHFGGAGWLEVYSDGIGRWEGERGSFVIKLLDESGHPVTGDDITCHVVADERAAYVGGDLYPSVSGTCEAEGAGATGYTVTVTRAGDAGPRTIGRGRFEVRPDRVTLLDLVVDR